VWSLYAKPAVVILVVVCRLGAQDFDWAPTYMLPFRIPTLYATVGVQASIASMHDTRVVDEGARTCATYGDGTGFIVAVTFGGEWWALPDAACAASIRLGWSNANYLAPGTVAPLVTGETLRTEYVLSTSRFMVGVQATAKKRAVWRYGGVGVGTEITAFLTPTMVQRERVVEPQWYSFATDPPSREVRLTTATAGGTNVHVSLTVAVGYDLSLGVGLYCSPAVEIGVPLTLNLTDFRLWRAGLAIPIAFSVR